MGDVLDFNAFVKKEKERKKMQEEPEGLQRALTRDEIALEKENVISPLIMGIGTASFISFYCNDLIERNSHPELKEETEKMMKRADKVFMETLTIYMDYITSTLKDAPIAVKRDITKVIRKITNNQKDRLDPLLKRFEKFCSKCGTTLEDAFRGEAMDRFRPDTNAETDQIFHIYALIFQLGATFKELYDTSKKLDEFLATFKDEPASKNLKHVLDDLREYSIDCAEMIEELILGIYEYGLVFYYDEGENKELSPYYNEEEFSELINDLFSMIEESQKLIEDIFSVLSTAKFVT